MEFDEANRWIIREAIRLLGPHEHLDAPQLQERLVEVVREHGEAIFARLSEEAREQLRKEGRALKDQEARLRRMDETIEYGRWLINHYSAETLGELPVRERLEFARLWSNATGGTKVHEN